MPFACGCGCLPGSGDLRPANACLPVSGRSVRGNLCKRAPLSERWAFTHRSLCVCEKNVPELLLVLSQDHLKVLRNTIADFGTAPLPSRRRLSQHSHNSLEYHDYAEEIAENSGLCRPLPI